MALSTKNVHTAPDTNPKPEPDLVAKADTEEPLPKPLDVESSADFAEKIPDVVTFGDPDLFRLMSKASSKAGGWMKSTKACEVFDGCIVQVTTQQGDRVAEALTFVPGVAIGFDVETGHRRFVRSSD